MVIYSLKINESCIYSIKLCSSIFIYVVIVCKISSKFYKVSKISKPHQPTQKEGANKLIYDTPSNT